MQPFTHILGLFPQLLNNLVLANQSTLTTVTWLQHDIISQHLSVACSLLQLSMPERTAPHNYCAQQLRADRYPDYKKSRNYFQKWCVLHQKFAAGMLSIFAKLSGVAPCIKPKLNYWITGHINLGNRKRFLPPLNPARKRLCHDLVPKSHLKWSCTVWILNQMCQANCQAKYSE